METGTATRERGIIFSGSMVRAILEGRKTQTRRIVKPQPEDNGRNDWDWIWRHPRVTEAGYCHTTREAMEKLMIPCCPYGAVGDRLWVRESYWLPDWHDRKPPTSVETGTGMCVLYDATGRPSFAQCPEGGKWKRRPSIHMPRWASRITLELTAVRVERLQEIGEADAEAEGMPTLPNSEWYPTLTQTFCHFWNSINSDFGWDKNPWVWVLEFKKV